MNILSKTGDPRFAEVYVAKMRGSSAESLVEFVDACDPRHPKSEKWVIVVSTQIGCPIGCLMCDSGTHFYGNLTKEEIFAQIDHVIQARNRGPEVGDLNKHPKLKIQFARMGEPALNPAVLLALEELPSRYPVRGLLPCIATTAPAGCESWFARLAEIKDRHYSGGRFQLQFSINSTSAEERDRLIPSKKWGLKEISGYGKRFFRKGDRKVALNFALDNKLSLDVRILKEYFDPGAFVVKITPVNPTDSAVANRVETVLSVASPDSVNDLANELEKAGFDAIISIGAREEIEIGSNCGQSVRKILSSNSKYVTNHNNTFNG